MSRGCSTEAAASLAIFFPNPDHDGEGPPFGCQREELDALFSTKFELVNEQDDLPTFPGREGRELLRLLLRTVSRCFFPLDGAGARVAIF